VRKNIFASDFLFIFCLFKRACAKVLILLVFNFQISQAIRRITFKNSLSANPAKGCQFWKGEGMEKEKLRINSTTEVALLQEYLHKLKDVPCGNV